MNLIIFGNQSGKGRHSNANLVYDVTISVAKNGRGARRVSIYLRNGTAQVISPDSGRVFLGMDENTQRLYFLPAARPSEGYKMNDAHVKQTETYGIRFTPPPIYDAAWEQFVGNYFILFDGQASLHYVDRGLKK